MSDAKPKRGLVCPWCGRNTRFHKGLLSNHINAKTSQRCAGAWQPKKFVEQVVYLRETQTSNEQPRSSASPVV